MKLIMIIILLLCFVIVAFCVYMYFYVKYRILHDCVYICNHLKNNISFNKNCISDILSDAYNGVNYFSKIYLKSDNKKNYKLFNFNEIAVFDNFFSSLGRGDVDFEINNLSYYLGVFKERECEAKDKMLKNGTTYAKLIFCLGIVIIILLL